jgi:hypothetical protein
MRIVTTDAGKAFLWMEGIPGSLKRVLADGMSRLFSLETWMATNAEGNSSRVELIRVIRGVWAVADNTSLCAEDRVKFEPLL